MVVTLFLFPIPTCRSKLQYLMLGLIIIIPVVMFALYYHASRPILVINKKFRTTSTSELNDTTETSELSDTIETINQSSFKYVMNKGYRHVLPRAAYFDRRQIHGHKNAVIVLAHVTKEVLKKNLILGCIVNGMHTKKFKILSFLMNGWIHRHHPLMTHDDVLIFCYNTTISRDCNNNVVIEYKNPKDIKQIISIKPEVSLFVPSFQPANKGRSSVMVCITAYGTPPYFMDWLHYQKTLGVDLVYISAQESFLNSTVYSDTFFQESLDTGFVQVNVWEEYLTKMEVFYHSQLLYYHDCLYRFQSVYDYAIIVDTDEFYIVGNGTLDRHIHQHLDEVFSRRPKIGALRVDQVIYHAPPGGFDRNNMEISDDGNLPRYAVRTSQRIDNFKSVSKLTATIELSVHTVVGLMPGFREYALPRHVAHVAHLKKKR